MSGGFTGVDVFFVISGFVITGMLAREWASDGRIRFFVFYARRIRRLVPALALVVAVTVVLSLLLQSPFGAQQTTAKTAWGAMLFVANIVIFQTTGGYFDAPAKANPLLNMWTLAVEEQFYLVFPAALLLGWVAARRSRRALGPPVLVIGAICLVSLALYARASSGHALVFGHSNPLGFAFYSSPTRAWEFGIGAALALVASRFLRLSSSVRNVVAFGGIVLVLVAAFAINDRQPVPLGALLLPVSGAALLLIAGTGGRSLAAAFLEHPVMTWVGDRSYSWYLWHWPLIVFAGIQWPGDHRAKIGAAILSLVPAAASFAWLEEPVRRSRRFRGQRLLQVTAVALAIPLGLSAILFVGGDKRWGLSWPLQASSQMSSHVVIQRGCSNPNWPDAVFDPRRCTWHVRHTQGSVFLAGDSEAFAWADGVIPAAAKLHYATTVASLNSCPFVTVPAGQIGGGSGPIKACADWQQKLLRYALRIRPTVVVLAAHSTAYVDPSRTGFSLVDTHGAPTIDDGDAVRLWEKALADIVSRLRAAGIGVVILQDVPEFDIVNDVQPMSILHRFPKPVSGSIAPKLRLRAPAAAAEREVSDMFPGSVVLYDPFHTLCHGGSCSFRTRHAALYSDGGHLSAHGAKLFAPSLVAAFKKATATR
jgi:peptidoglycan/LPS O-acetylase OafA/YrhL